MRCRPTSTALLAFSINDRVLIASLEEEAVMPAKSCKDWPVW
jgi:hypothetical protein